MPDLAIALSPDEANALVYAISVELLGEGENLSSQPLSTRPGDLAGFAASCRRISRLAAVNGQLLWRAHWGRCGGEPPTITAAEDTWIEVTLVLHERAEGRRQSSDPRDFAPDSPTEFDRAARRIARAFGEAEAVPA